MNFPPYFFLICKHPVITFLNICHSLYYLQLFFSTSFSMDRLSMHSKHTYNMCQKYVTINIFVGCRALCRIKLQFSPHAFTNIYGRFYQRSNILYHFSLYEGYQISLMTSSAKYLQRVAERPCFKFRETGVLGNETFLFNVANFSFCLHCNPVPINISSKLVDACSYETSRQVPGAHCYCSKSGSYIMILNQGIQPVVSAFIPLCNVSV